MTDGNIVQFNRQPVDPINNQTFTEAIDSVAEQTAITVQRLGRMTQLNVTTPVVSVIDKPNLPLGLVADAPIHHCEPGQSHPSGRHAHIETSKEFPQFLRSLPEVSGNSRALRLAASYVVAYGLFIAAIADGRSYVRDGVSTMNDEVWTANYRRDGVDVRRSFAHRFAGAIALTHHGYRKGIRSLDDDLPKSGLPAHIAGLINPLSHIQVEQSYAVFDNNGKWSRASEVSLPPRKRRK